MKGICVNSKKVEKAFVVVVGFKPPFSTLVKTDKWIEIIALEFETQLEIHR